ncbi:MAG: hypothetical protein WKF65_08500 [Gaiellaceae bacterium]
MSFAGEDTLPPRLATLVRQLQAGGAQAPPEQLSQVTALEELLAVTGAMIGGHGAPYPDDRASLKDDVLRSFDALGPASAELHRTACGDFRQLAARLDKLLNDVAGAHVLRAAANVLLTELASPPSRVAAFADCAQAFYEGEFVGVCEMRLRYLRSVVEAAGHEWSERARRLHEALADDYALLWVHGALDPPHAGERHDHIDSAGLSVDERLCLCEAIVAAAPSTQPVVVWLAFANARVSRFYLRKGPIEFYDSRVWPAVLAGDWPGNLDWTQPAELADPDAARFLADLPDENFVLARVALEHASSESARERARDLARAAIELIGWESDWVLMDGAAAHAGSGWFGTIGFTDPRERANRSAGDPLLDVADTLADVEDELLQRLADGEATASAFLADTRWRRAVARLPDAEHRVALVVALFERVLVPSAAGSDTWYGACARYFELLFAFDDVEAQIADAGEYGVHAVSRDPAARDDFLRFDRAIMEHPRGLSFRVRLDEVIRLAQTMHPHVPAGSMEERMLAEVEQKTNDGPALAAWLGASRTRFGRLLARAKRQRNAVAHGTRPVPGVLATVEPMLDYLAGRMIGAVHYCAVEQRDLIAELER